MAKNTHVTVLAPFGILFIFMINGRFFLQGLRHYAVENARGYDLVFDVLKYKFSSRTSLFNCTPGIKLMVDGEGLS